MYIDFKNVADNKDLFKVFCSEATEKGIGSMLSQKNSDLYAVFNESVQYPGVYLIMIVGHSDYALIRYAKSHQMPRGFPILWIPGKKIQYFGFYPKFDNDDRQEPDNQSEFNGVTHMNFFKKWSGFLSQVLVFEIESEVHWTITTKNSANKDADFLIDAKRIFEQYVTKELIKEMYENNLHLCAEIISKKDQVHGTRVLAEVPIITAIGSGCIFNLDQSKPDRVAKSIVDFYDHVSIVDFCTRMNLPCDSAVIIESPESCTNFMLELSKKRDFMDDDKLEELLHKLSDVTVIQGNITHQKILGNCLEGIVINMTKRGGIKLIKKYKFPGYTIRTLLLRTVFTSFVFSPELKKEAQHFVDNWCVTQEGRNYWYEMALRAFIRKNNFIIPEEDNTVGVHIQIIEDVLANSIANPIETFNYILMSMTNATVIICLGPIGSGKSSVAETLSKQIPNAIHIDGDILDLSSMLVLSLKEERNDYTMFYVIRALMAGQVPIISCGGGVLFANNRKEFKFVLQERIHRSLGIYVKIVVLISGPFDDIIQLDQSHNPTKTYSDIKSVENATRRRIEKGEWTVDPKFLVNKTPYNDALNHFVRRITEISKGNSSIAQTVINTADYVFGFPIINELNYGIQSKLNYQLIVPKVGNCNLIPMGKFNQIRVLVAVSHESIGQQIGHVTIKFSNNTDISYTSNDFAELKTKGQQIKSGQIITMTSTDKKATISFAVPDVLFHDDQTTHITLNPGQHAPKEMKYVRKCINDKKEIITIKTKNNKEISYPLANIKTESCGIKFLDVFGI
jgi:hypothetical protein